MASELDCRVSERVATLTLRAPERRNALSAGLISEMIAALDDLERRDDVGAMVVTGAPPAFCAGAVVGDLASAGGVSSSEERRKGLVAIYEAFLRFARSPLPSVAAVNGPAVGAGMNLALCCDVRLAAPSARFDTRFLELGLHPGGGHTYLGLRAMGPQAVAASLLFGERLSAERALQVGLVWSVVEGDELLDRARALAGRAAAVHPDLVKRTRQTLAATAAAPDLAAAVDIELDAQAWSMSQPWFQPQAKAPRQ